MKKVNLYNQDGSLCSEAQLLLSTNVATLSTIEALLEDKRLLKEFKAKLAEEDVKEFTRLRRNAMHVRRLKKNPLKFKKLNAKYRAEQKVKVVDKQIETKKVSLYNEDGFLIFQAQFLIDIIVSELPTNADKTLAKKCLNKFRSYLSDEDSKTFNTLRKKARNARWFNLNKIKKKEINRRRRQKSPNESKTKSAEFRLKNPGHHAEWRAANPEKLKKEQSKPESKLRSAVYSAFKRIRQNKPTDTIALLGCTWEEAKAHIESLFQEGMTWENHGRGDGKWQIDHIRPVASFKGASEEELKQMNHISNLQPLWTADNLSKSDKWD